MIYEEIRSRIDEVCGARVSQARSRHKVRQRDTALALKRDQKSPVQ